MVGRRGDAELAAVMRKLLTMPGSRGYVGIDTMNGKLDLDVEGVVQLTEEEQQAIEEVWDR